MQERSEFRIVYPLPARPIVTIGAHRFRALDISEQALRLDQRDVTRTLSVGERVAGQICLAQQVEHPFEGQVRRLDAQVAVVLLDDSFRIGLAVIYREQRHLHAHYPDWR